MGIANRSFYVIVQVIAIGILLTFSYSMAGAAEEDDPYKTVVQDMPVQQPQKPSHKFDFFTLSFMGVSTGCMMFASAVHWSFTQRREMEEKIQSLDTFLATHCSVSFQVSGSTESDRMISRMKELENSRERNIQAYADDKMALFKTINDVEEELVKIWG